MSLNELKSLLIEDGVLHTQSNHTQEIASDENPRLLLVRDIAKAINEAKKEKATTSIDKTEYDLDLQRAIQLSLRSGSRV